MSWSEYNRAMLDIQIETEVAARIAAEMELIAQVVYPDYEQIAAGQAVGPWASIGKLSAADINKVQKALGNIEAGPGDRILLGLTTEERILDAALNGEKIIMQQAKIASLLRESEAIRFRLDGMLNDAAYWGGVTSQELRMVIHNRDLAAKTTFTRFGETKSVGQVRALYPSLLVQ